MESGPYIIFGTFGTVILTVVLLSEGANKQRFFTLGPRTYDCLLSTRLACLEERHELTLLFKRSYL